MEDADVKVIVAELTGIRTALEDIAMVLQGQNPELVRGLDKISSRVVLREQVKIWADLRTVESEGVVRLSDLYVDYVAWCLSRMDRPNDLTDFAETITEVLHVPISDGFVTCWELTGRQA